MRGTLSKLLEKWLGDTRCQNPATFAVQACTTVAEVSVVGLIGFGLTFFGVVGTIIGGLVRAGHLTSRQLESHPPVASVDEAIRTEGVSSIFLLNHIGRILTIGLI
jgi:hypothetical protein